MDELKEIAHKYASLYFGDNNLLAEISEIWKDKKKTLEDYYFDLMKEYEKFSCSNCWKEYKLFWKINEKKMEEKITKKSKGCRRCPNAIKTQDSNQDWNEEKKKIKEYFHLDLSDKIFNDLCRNCFFLLINTITAIQNSKTASKEFFERLGQIGRWEIDTKNQIIKVWERDEIWKIGLKNQNLNNVLKYMNF